MAATSDDRVTELERANTQLRRQLAACSTELKEARDQQTATAEVLQVINSSPGELAPVFDAILEKAHTLCGADHGHLSVYQGGQFRALATHGLPEAFANLLRQPFHPGLNVARRLFAGEAVIQFSDMAAMSYGPDDHIGRGVVELAGARTLLIIALRKDDALLGYITAHRIEVRPFSEKEIALLQNFAAQAVIAMENARLLTETSEALEQQTATAEVLQVINSSPGDLTPVFDAMLEKAMRLCEAAHGTFLIYDGQVFRPAAVRGEPRFAEYFRQQTPFRPAETNPLGRLVRGERLIHVADARADDAYRDAPEHRRVIDLGGIRTSLVVPLRKAGALLGAVRLYRQEVRPFSDKQIALVENFAAQAVIAMENARLLTETREALEQQTATAEVLGVINSSPGDLAPVFDAILDKAHSLCDVAHGSLQLYDGVSLRAVATHGVSDAFADILRHGYRAADSPASRGLIEGRRFVQIADCAEIDHPVFQSAAELAGIRTVLFVPLRGDDALLGLISSARREVQPFSDKEIALLQNFAAQAVIAMENARLLTETREALEQQTATAEVLQVINSSPGDLKPVFDAMLERATRLCDAPCAMLWTQDGDAFSVPATFGVPEAFAGYLGKPLEMQPSVFLGALQHGETFVHNLDLADTDSYRSGNPLNRAVVDLGGARTGLLVPLQKDGRLLGAFRIYRHEVRPFTDKQIALLQNFAAQAVIAMENARLLTETREALEQQTATAEVLQVINSSPGDLAPVFDAMLERAVRLCEFDLSSLWTFDGVAFRPVARHGVSERFWKYLQDHTPPPFIRALAGESLIHIPDVQSISAFMETDFVRGLQALGLEPPRSLLIVSLRKDEALLGVIVAYRREVRPFSDKQIALLQNFAAQAVIAMENARLLTETREALEQQTATAEVLQVINSSPGDLAPVFDAMLSRALRLCGAAFGVLWTHDGELLHASALRGVAPAFAEVLTRAPHAIGSDNAHGRLLAGESVVHVLDLEADDAYRSGDPIRRALVELGGGRVLLAVPLRTDDALLGIFTIYRQEVRPFSDKQIGLLKNFAAQAVIAMENARLITETREALEQQTATAEVLQVINASRGDLAPVFEAILEKAQSLCGSGHGTLFLREGEHFRPAAIRGVPEPIAEGLRRGVGADAPVSRPLLAGEPFVHLVDMAMIDYPMIRLARESGVRTLLSVPLRKGGDLFGMIVAARFESGPFSDKQIALLQNFAAQAVIAMENARLLSELRERTSDLQESLQYQTAISDVLKVISQSNFDLGPVLENVIETALRLCRAHMGSIFRLEDGVYRWAVGRGLEPAYQEIERRTPIPAGPGTLVGRAALEGRAVQIADALADPLYAVKDEANLARARTMLGVPLLREGAPIGVIAMARDRVEPFSEKEVALVTTFADQAVIAIENARLVNDLRQRTHDLQESLEYQTAISDVLRVISRSGAELGPVLDTLVETAARICRAESGFIFRLHDGLCRMVASFGIPAEYRDFQERNPIAPGRGTLAGRTALERRAVHIEDAAADPEYTRVQAIQLGNQRTMLGVPLVREDALIGVITLARSRVEAFTDKEIALVATFADQAVIAIENARLIDELRERTAELGRSVEELKMLGEVGQAVSSTLDLRAVLSTILTASLGVTMANAGAVFRYGRADRAFRLVEVVGWDEALTRSVSEMPIAESESAMGEAVTRRTPIQLPDIADRAGYPLRDVTLAAGFHSALIVPLVGAERIFGAIVLMRQQAGEFPAETVRLMQTLASQSVLAIQNARLFREIADKSEQLALASQHKSQFLANMSHELRTPLNAILGYAELLVDGIYGVLPEKAQGVLERVQNNGKHLLALINDVLDLAKIEAGQLALTLEDYALAEVVSSVVSATEPLAAAKGLTFTAIVQEGMPRAHGDARRVSQVLLNLVGNAIKFTDAGEVEISAAAEGRQFVLTVRDTGPGIADADQERIFGEFQQIENTDTRKKGGTGLGLAISKRMVEMQGGMISVDSALGRGSTFRVVLPVHVEPALEEAAE